MATREINAHDKLWAFVAQYPTRKAAALALGISAVYLGDIMNHRRDVPPRILEQLGLRRAVVAR